jgi:hypothetical protein
MAKKERRILEIVEEMRQLVWIKIVTDEQAE